MRLSADEPPVEELRTEFPRGRRREEGGEEREKTPGAELGKFHTPKIS